MTAQPTFAFEGVEVVIGDRTVLTGIDTEIPGTGITVVTGPSGSGKSTLARLCNRLIDPTAGQVRFRGVPMPDLDVLDLRRRVGFVFQRATTFPGTVADNLAATDVDDRDRWRELLDRVDLDPGTVLDQDAASLSGGEAQRVCVVRALLLDPEVLVADEPTSAVDHTTTRRIEHLARELADGGVPILWITHDDAQLRRLADHRLSLRNGTLDTNPGDTS
ncbi:MAG: ATP-binding cassette domain-containing protein [Acidimicrobiales bacterium]|nr:ATP-binding cassette domain-containing protein [Acidimicrobiales bacterium]